MSFEKELDDAADAFVDALPEEIRIKDVYLSGAQWAKAYLTKPTAETEKAAEEYAKSSVGITLNTYSFFDTAREFAAKGFLAGASHIQAQRDAERKEIERQILDVCYFIDKKEMSETTIAVRNTLAHIIHELKRKGAGE
jgi:hypothetical protein